MAVQGGQGLGRPFQQPEQIAVGEVLDRADGEQVGVGGRDQVCGQRGERDPEAADPPGGHQATHGRSGVEAAQEGGRPVVVAQEVEIGGDPAVDGGDDR